MPAHNDYEIIYSKNRRQGQRVSQEIKDRIKHLRSQGLTYAQINRRLGVSPVTIAAVVKEMRDENGTSS